jgi:phospholipid transport system substrate-binding protein
MKKLLMTGLITQLLVFGLLSTATAEIRLPEVIIEQTSTQLLDIINQESDRIREDVKFVDSIVNDIIVPIIDLQSMAKLILGKHWKTASEQQRNDFIGEFKNMLIRTYAKSVADFGHAEINIIPNAEAQKGKFYRVKTQVTLSGSPPLNVDYVFRQQKDKQWKAFDLVVDGLSMIKNFRSSFSQEIEETSLDALINRMRNTNTEQQVASDTVS